MAITISSEELRHKMEQGEDFILIEVLDPDEYQRAHLPGAINIPLESIGHTALEQFRPEQELVVYCGSQLCQASDLAADKLETFGFKRIVVYKAGKKGWQQAGYPLETSAIETGAPTKTGL